MGHPTFNARPDRRAGRSRGLPPTNRPSNPTGDAAVGASRCVPLTSISVGSATDDSAQAHPYSVTALPPKGGGETRHACGTISSPFDSRRGHTGDGADRRAGSRHAKVDCRGPRRPTARTGGIFQGHGDPRRSRRSADGLSSSGSSRWVTPPKPRAVSNLSVIDPHRRTSVHWPRVVIACSKRLSNGGLQ